MDRPFAVGIASMAAGGILVLFGAIFLTIVLALVSAYITCLQTCPAGSECGGGPLAPSWTCTLPEASLVVLLIAVPIGSGIVLLFLGFRKGVKRSSYRTGTPRSS